MRAFFVALLLFAFPQSVYSQTLSDEEVKALALEAILENPEIIMEAMAILQRQQQAEQIAAQAEVLRQQRTLLETDANAPTHGAESADAIIVEFFDYNCPYCKRAAGDVAALLEADDNVRVVYREWPILGEGSLFAARAALAAREQGKYQEMHDALMTMRGRAEEASVLAAAEALDMDIVQLRADMNSQAVTDHIETSRQLAQSLGFTGTPAFVIGDALVPGAVPLADLQAYVAASRDEG